MDIKEREAFQKFCEENFDFERHEQTYFDEQTQCYENDIGEDTESINMAWSAWQARAKVQSIPDGYKLVKKPILLGNPNVDWNLAPEWAKYWFKDGYSGKCVFCSIKPKKDTDLGAFVLSGKYRVVGTSDFGYKGHWSKSMTSKKDSLNLNNKEEETK